MPTEVTPAGLQQVSGLAGTLSGQKSIKAKEAGSDTRRQALPAPLQPAADVDAIHTAGISAADVARKVESLNFQVQNIQRDLQFSVDADSGRTVIRVIDRETRETIRTIPPEAIFAVTRRLGKHSGALLSTNV